MTQLTPDELSNLIYIVSTHPTPEGVGSPAGITKLELINKLREMLKNASTEEK